jgi:hypothetical protein
MNEMLVRKNFYFNNSSHFLPDDSAVRITRELWWTSQEFSSVAIIIIITTILHSYTPPGRWTVGPFVTAVQRRIFTPSIWSTNQFSYFVSRHMTTFGPLNPLICKREAVCQLWSSGLWPWDNTWHAKFLVLTQASLNMTAFRDKSPCTLFEVDQSSYRFHRQGDTHFWNVGLLQLVYTALYLRKLSSSQLAYSPHENVVSYRSVCSKMV